MMDSLGNLQLPRLELLGNFSEDYFLKQIPKGKRFDKTQKTGGDERYQMTHMEQLDNIFSV